MFKRKAYPGSNAMPAWDTCRVLFRKVRMRMRGSFRFCSLPSFRHYSDCLNLQLPNSESPECCSPGSRFSFGYRQLADSSANLSDNSKRLLCVWNGIYSGIIFSHHLAMNLNSSGAIIAPQNAHCHFFKCGRAKSTSVLGRSMPSSYAEDSTVEEMSSAPVELSRRSAFFTQLGSLQ